METETNDQPSGIQEAEASYFARCLLMPKNLILEEINTMPKFSLLDDLQVHILAKRFQVNDSMMAYRIGEILNDQQA